MVDQAVFREPITSERMRRRPDGKYEGDRHLELRPRGEQQRFVLMMSFDAHGPYWYWIEEEQWPTT